MKTYPRLSALIRRARWHASIRMRIDATDDELNELVAYGWIGVCTAIRAGHRGPGYLYRAAYNQMLRDYWRQRHADALRFAAELDAANLGIVRQHDERALADDLAAELFDMFVEQRQKRGRRGASAAQRDVQIISLLVAGFSNEGIGLEIGISAHDVAHYRKQIQARLLTAARERDTLLVSDEPGETGGVV